MIVTPIGDLARYRGLSAAMDAAISWLANGAWKSLPDGRHESAAAPGSGGKPLFYASLSGYNTKAEPDCRWETHRKHTDIQILLSGFEYVDVLPAAGMASVAPYDAEKDVEYYSVPETGTSRDEAPSPAVQRVLLAPGVAAIFFPEDAHRPCISAGGPGAVRKLVVKVADAEAAGSASEPG
ncbi:MAG: hypothetical protein A2Z99_20580 [Treponema sp. GWB1_62_6]|nr:MAG: hypothetical protein A2001_16550 [Treponema sp. GWC1_61_84]OHE69776.1 MAG: hypothetical protein A2413_00355 [Treponema sp. RIFOXYC1_FULL_61_9]OHE71586.1 MAG: hypothetical protein A2Z99_20580 [Treponema sp. GWB1_62_6]HCM27426.1 hypothetical protein [Treponema sp.]